jgi:hypothetical protein
LAEHLLKLHPDSNAAAKGLLKRRDWVVAQGLQVMHECKPDNLLIVDNSGDLLVGLQG